MSKKVVVKKIDEDKKEIVLGKKDKSLIVFFRSYWLVLFITALILSLTVFALSVIYTVSSLFNSLNLLIVSLLNFIRLLIKPKISIYSFNIRINLISKPNS